MWIWWFRDHLETYLSSDLDRLGSGKRIKVPISPIVRLHYKSPGRAWPHVLLPISLGQTVTTFFRSCHSFYCFIHRLLLDAVSSLFFLRFHPSPPTLSPLVVPVRQGGREHLILLLLLPTPPFPPLRGLCPSCCRSSFVFVPTVDDDSDLFKQVASSTLILINVCEMDCVLRGRVGLPCRQGGLALHTDCRQCARCWVECEMRVVACSLAYSSGPLTQSFFEVVDAGEKEALDCCLLSRA